jgi:hypothetical protein
LFKTKGAQIVEQWELYTDEELVAGAERWGLTVSQERQRIRILQTDFRQWPLALQKYLREKHSNGLEFIGFTLIQHSVVTWLKQGNGVPVDATVSMRPPVVAAAVAMAAA